MTQVRTHHHPRLDSAPQPFQNLHDQFIAGCAHQQRHDPERSQDSLQKGQLHLEGVLGRMCGVQDPHLGKRPHGIEPVLIDRHQPQRSLKRGGGTQRNPFKIHEMRRPEKYHPQDPGALRLATVDRPIRRSVRSRRNQRGVRSRLWAINRWTAARAADNSPPSHGVPSVRPDRTARRRPTDAPCS